MATRVPERVSPARRTPRQARSRATVAAIVEAAARVLGREGWSGFTTNRVAGIAGVSIGSLYQYFPDKLALANAVANRHFADVLGVLHALAAAAPPSRNHVEDFVRGMIAIHAVDPELHGVLLDNLPRTRAHRAARAAFEAEYAARYRNLIAAARGRGRAHSIDTTAHVLAAAVEGVIHDAARRDGLKNPALPRELADLVCGYLVARRGRRIR